MKTRAQIEQELSTLNKAIAAEFSSFCSEPRNLMRSLIEAKISSAVVNKVQGIVGTYSTAELVIAGEILAECKELSDATSDDEVAH